MLDNEKLNEILEKIDASKEVLSTMPKNNEKNIDEYLEKVDNLLKEYEMVDKEIEEELILRFKEKTNVEENKEVSALSGRIDTIEKVLYLLEDKKSSQGKIELDKNIYKIGKFYKENLESVNRQIEICINKFSSVGINLKESDFDYTPFVTEYMKVFLQEMDKKDLNSDTLKAKFEEIYWKCPDLIVHIELNIRNLYLKYQGEIDKFLEKEKNELLKKWQKPSKEIINAYLEIKKRLIDEKAIDKKGLVEKFLKGEFLLNDYTDAKLKENALKLLPEELLENIEENQEKVENIIKFLNSLYEYQDYLKFKFIVDDVKKIYEEKDKYKKAYLETKKKIQNEEKKLKKINKKLSSKSFFTNKNKETKQNSEMANTITELKNLYKELDLNEFYTKVNETLNENSTIYDVLVLASSYYMYLTDCLIRTNPSILPEEIDETIEKLNHFLKSPFITAISHINFVEEKDIALIIKDRYKLLNFKIEKEDLSEGQIDNLVENAEKIIIGINIRRAKLKIEDLEEICNINKVLKIK